MKEKFKKLLNKFFDYRIVGEYYDTSDGIHYRKKYIKKYFLRKRK